MNAANKLIPQSICSKTSAQTDQRATIIPKSFWVGGMKYTVDLEEIHFENGQVIGNVQYANQRIVVDPSLAPIQTTEQTFIHELVHLMFHMCCEIELQRNERLVDVFSQFLYQALTTAEPRPASDLIITTKKGPSEEVIENMDEKSDNAGDLPVISGNTVDPDNKSEETSQSYNPQFSNAPTLEELEPCWFDGREALLQECIE